MHPRTREVLDYLDSQRANLWSTVQSISPEFHERQPEAGGWSIAGIVEHLALAEASIAKLLLSRIDDARQAGLGPEQATDPMIPTMDTARLLDREQPMDSPRSLRPQVNLDMAAARAALDQARRTLRDGVLAADGLALSEVVAMHRYLGPINIYQWLVFVGAHERRHTEQIRAVSAALEAGRP